MGTSTRPAFATLPVRAKTLVPLELCVPMDAKLSAPSRMMCEALAMVSTLLTIVGFWNRPDTAGNGGRGRGMPRLPSTEAMSAVSSPQTNAPAPIFTRRENWKPDRVRRASRAVPSAFSTPMALLIRSMARGYSARQ